MLRIDELQIRTVVELAPFHGLGLPLTNNAVWGFRTEIQVAGRFLCSQWAWTLWSVTLPLEGADRSKPLQLACRAVDQAYNAQPEVGDRPSFCL